MALIYILYIYIYIYHHYHVMLLAQISQTFSCHLSLSSITSGRFSRLHPRFIQSCCREVLVGHPTFLCLCEGVHRRTPLTSSFLLLHQCSSCLVHLIWMVLEIGGGWPYSCCFVGCFQDLFNMTRRILAQFPSSFFSVCFVSIQVVHPYSKINMITAWKTLRFILSDFAWKCLIKAWNQFFYLCKIEMQAGFLS